MKTIITLIVEAPDDAGDVMQAVEFALNDPQNYGPYDVSEWDVTITEKKGR